MVESGINVRAERRTQLVRELGSEQKRIEYKIQESDISEKIGINYMKQLFLLIALCYQIGCNIMLLELIICKLSVKRVIDFISCLTSKL